MRWKALVLAASTVFASPALAADPLVLPVRTVGPRSVESPLIQKNVGRPRTAWSDSMQLLAQIYSVVDYALAFGDTDHDGFNEVIMAVTFGPDFDYRILEEQGNNTYVEVFVGPYFDPYAAGDFDKDGKAEVLGQYGNLLLVYESPSPTTHPSAISWQSPPLTNIIGYPTAADTDGDGWMEIIHSINTLGVARLVIYENTGDNTFSQVYYQVESPQDDGPKVVADLDGDGRLEIALCGTYGYLHIYESPSDNVWQQTFFDSTGLDNAYAVAGGADTDGNGKSELFVTGDVNDAFPEPLGTRLTYVYEATGDNSFTRVTVLPYFDAHRGGLRSCVANLDAVGRDEFILRVYPERPELLIYRSVAPGQWAVAFSFSDPDPNAGHGFPQAFDVNRNGRQELFWVGIGNANFGSTWVLEHMAVSPTDAPPDLAPAVERLIVLPNPCLATATLLLTGRSRTAASTAATFDASGRLVARTAVRGGDRVQWSPPLLRPGIYFLRLEDSSGSPLARGRVTVLR